MEEKEAQQSYYRVERSYGSFQRVLTLPEDADEDSLDAIFKNGVLTITIGRKTLAETAMTEPHPVLRRSLDRWCFFYV